MRTFHLLREQRFARPLDEVFAFFGDARNLQTITPPWLRFRILRAPEQLEAGSTIDYSLRVRGLPIRWTSLISDWNPPHTFVDEQLRGPYSLWHHTHTFVDEGDVTLVRDEVRYAVPGGLVVERFLVRPDLERIFDYRRDVLAEIFGERAQRLSETAEVVAPLHRSAVVGAESR